jgi:hypothetical protein
MGNNINVGLDGLYDEYEVAQQSIDDLATKVASINIEGLELTNKLLKLEKMRDQSPIIIPSLEEKIFLLTKEIDKYFDIVEDLFDEIEVEHFLTYGAKGENPNNEE